MPRPFRVPDDLYRAALARARRDGRTLTSVVVERLEQYVASDVEVVDEAADEAPTIP